MITWNELHGRSLYAVYAIDVDYPATAQAGATRYRVWADQRLIGSAESEDVARELARRWDSYLEQTAGYITRP